MRNEIKLLPLSPGYDKENMMSLTMNESNKF